MIHHHSLSMRKKTEVNYMTKLRNCNCSKKIFKLHVVYKNFTKYYLCKLPLLFVRVSKTDVLHNKSASMCISDEEGKKMMDSEIMTVKYLVDNYYIYI